MVAALRVVGAGRPRGAALRPRWAACPRSSRPSRERLAGALPVRRLGGFATRVKEAAQGAALIADGLAGGAHRDVVEAMRLRQSRGSVLDHLHVAGADEVRRRLRARVRILIAGSHDPRHRRVGRARRRGRSSPSTTSATSTSSASARPTRCGSAGAGTPRPRSSRWRASSPTTPSCTAGAWRTIRTWSPSWPGTGVLLGNAPDVLRRVRDPAELFPLPRGAAASTCPTRALATDPLPAAGRWLVKPARGGGGQGVRRWRGQPLAADRDPPGARRGRERVGLVRGRRPPVRGSRVDRAAPPAGELPLRGQRHAARRAARPRGRRSARSPTP